MEKVLQDSEGIENPGESLFLGKMWYTHSLRKVPTSSKLSKNPNTDRRKQMNFRMSREGSEKRYNQRAVALFRNIRSAL